MGNLEIGLYRTTVNPMLLNYRYRHVKVTVLAFDNFLNLIRHYDG